MEDMEYDDEVVNNINLDFSMGFCIAKEIIQDLLKKHFHEMQKQTDAMTRKIP